MAWFECFKGGVKVYAQEPKDLVQSQGLSSKTHLIKIKEVYLIVKNIIHSDFLMENLSFEHLFEMGCVHNLQTCEFHSFFCNEGSNCDVM